MCTRCGGLALLFKSCGKTAPDMDASSNDVDKGNACKMPPLPVAVAEIPERPFGGGLVLANQDTAEAQFDVSMMSKEGLKETGDGWATIEFMGWWFGVGGCLTEEISCTLGIQFVPAVAEFVE